MIQSFATCLRAAGSVRNNGNVCRFAPSSRAVALHFGDLRIMPLFCRRDSAVDENAFCLHNSRALPALYILTTDAGFADALRPRSYRALSTGEFLCAPLTCYWHATSRRRRQHERSGVRGAERIKIADQTGKKILFLLSIKPGETWEQFKERVVTTAHETGFLKRSRTKVARGDRCAGWGLFAAFILVES